MKLNYCNEELTPRQDLQWLNHQVIDCRDHLWELCAIDCGLKGNKNLYTAFSALEDASTALATLRAVASDIRCVDLAACWHATTPFNN